jgi:hypothetical protein
MIARRILFVFLAFALALSGCANKFADTDAAVCGYRSAPFDEFAACIRADFQKAEEHLAKKPRSDYDLSSTSTSDPHNEFYSEFVTTLDRLAASYTAAKKRTKGKKDKTVLENALYSKFDAVRADFAQKQQLANQRTATIAAVLVGGAALVAICAKGGCGGGGQPQNLGDHQGCCSWHGGMAGTCQAGRVLCNDGNPSPTCTCP